MTIPFCCSRRSRGYPLPHTTGARNISNPNNDGFKVLKDRLNQAISQKNTQIMKKSLLELINENVYINEPLIFSDSTALMIAAQDGHQDIVKLLVDNKAGVNLAHKDGWTALMTAAQNGHTDVVKLLVEAGANLDQVNNNGDTALMIAAQDGHQDIVKLLLEKGADANLVNNGGWTALVMAAEYENKKIVELLLEKGANVNKPDTDGWTALMIAAKNGNQDIVVLLLEKLIKDNIQTIRKPIDNYDACPILLNNYNELVDPVEFHGKFYELSSLVNLIYVKGKDSLAQGREIKFTVPHNNNVVSYSSLSELFQDIQFVEFTQSGD